MGDSMNFVQTDTLDGVILTKLKTYRDERGYLMEFFRHDEVSQKHWPVMGYISSTLPKFTRGPHEHVHQTDIFAFVGPGDFMLVLWDNRKNSKTYGHRAVYELGEKCPASIVIPEGVVHAYHCISTVSGTVVNVPNQLYAGEGKKQPVDEVRHEDDAQSPFVIDLKKLIQGRVA